MTGPDWTAATWRKSRHSEGGDGCVEWARLGGLVGVRDSRNPTAARLAFHTRDWQAFINHVRLSPDM